MDQPPQHLLPLTEQEKYARLPHKERWEALKPIIVQLYIGKFSNGGKSTKLEDVVAFMKTHYSFHAAPSEYPHHFRAWKVSKRVLKEDMGQVVSALGRRKRPGTSTSLVSIQEGDREKPIEVKKFKRCLVDQRRSAAAQAHPLTIPPGILSSFHLPYSALVQTLPFNRDYPSPFGPQHPTPDAIHIHSPASPSPDDQVTAPSPNMQLIYEKAKSDHTSLFLQGRRNDLLSGMCREDRRIMVDYFHDFFLHGFIMAKYWGQVVPENIVIPAAAVSTPGFLSSSAASPIAMGSVVDPTSTQNSQGEKGPQAPTSLCRWAIHVDSDQLYVEKADEETDEETENTATQNPPPPSFQEALRQSVMSSDFSTTPADTLPLAKESITELLVTNTKAMAVDAWKLAIISGNDALLSQLSADSYSYDGGIKDAIEDEIAALHPFHLAATFLDGSRTCCLVSRTLTLNLRVHRHYIDALGHTILDAFMVSVLRSHTRIDPGIVNHSFRAEGRFPGEEKDICGRWDADAHAIRELHRQGQTRIPAKWKHVFCHTSAQAVCHSLTSIYLWAGVPDINHLSGLFLRQCTTCGIETRLGPLHMVVVSAFYMGQMGMKDETLFGALAVVVCLLSLGADPCRRVEISLDYIRDSREDQSCQHPELSSAEFMLVLPEHIVSSWSEALQIGWKCIYETLARAERFSDELDTYSCGNARHGDPKLPCNEPRIGTLWALIQAELLTYRRLQVGDSWISSNFLMEDIIPWLRGDSNKLTMPLVTNKLIRPYFRCGWFHHEDYKCATASGVCTEHFMNLEDYGRANFIGP